MKKSLLALAVLGAFAGAASAQSSLTVFGIVDLSVNSIKNGSTTIKSMDSEQLNSNRLGFRGNEDLGGGMGASFWLEAGFSPDVGAVGGGNGLATAVKDSTGTSYKTSDSAFFNRRSTVSLTGGFGEVRLGRDYTNTFTNVASFDAYGANGFGNFSKLYGTTTLGSGAGTVVRANNMVGYFTPGNLGGVYASLQLAAGEGVGGTSTAAGGTSASYSAFNKYRGARLGYAAGPVDVAVAMSQTDAAGGEKYKVFNIGASYNLGVAKILAQYDQRKFGAKKYTSYQFSTSVPLGQGEFRASYAKGNAEGGGTSADDASLFGLEYIYNLSKRTAVYTQYGRLSNKGASALSVGGAGVAGTASTGYGVGVRHIF